MTRHAASPATTGTTPVTVSVFRSLAVGAVAVLGWQFVTAAGLFTGGGAGLHGTGSIVLHVVTGLLTTAALWHRSTAGGPLWPAVLAAVVFVLTFVQGWFGSIPGLVVHLPGALVITAGTVWLAAWSFLRMR